MGEASVTHGSFVIERSYPSTIERVFAAFSDPNKKRKWFAEGKAFDVLGYELDFRVGGTERSQFRAKGGPMQGRAFTNDTTYLDIEANRRIVFAYTMALDGRRFSASLATVELIADGSGTELVFTEQGAFWEGADGAQMREQGWGGLLEALGRELGSGATE